MFETPNLRVINTKLCTENYSNDTIEGLKNQARDVLLWVLGDEDMVGEGNMLIDTFKSEEDINKYLGTLIIPKTGKSSVAFISPEVEEKWKNIDECAWLTVGQRKKIQVGAEYIEIDGVRLMLLNESNEEKLSGFGDYKHIIITEATSVKRIAEPTLKQKQHIIDFIGGSQQEQSFFFQRVLGIEI